MRPIPPVTSQRARAYIATLLSGAAFAASSGQLMSLDLRQVPYSGRTSLGVPASSAGGYGGQSTPTARIYQLPISVELIRVVPEDGTRKLLVELQIRNTGKSRFTIPSCLDEQKAYKANATDFHSFAIGLTFRNHEKKFDEDIDVTAGSPLDPHCSISLNPGDALVIIDHADVPSEVADGRGFPAVQGYVEELQFENGQYRVKAQSARAETAFMSVNLLQR